MKRREVEAALRRLPAPEPGPDLLERILHSRAIGRRLTFPPAESGIAWRWLAAAAVVVVLVGGTWVLSLSLSKIGESRFVGQDPLAELREMIPWQSRGAQSSGETPLPKYSLITSELLDPSRVMEGVWTYQSETTTDGVLTTRGESTEIRVARATYLGHPAWMVNTGRQLRDELWGGPYTDTTYLDAASLRPRYTVAQTRKRRTRFVQTFSADSGYESIEITGAAPRSFHGAIAFPFPRNALFVNDWSLRYFPALLPALPFKRGWGGTLYQVAFLSHKSARHVAPLDLRVVGTDRITVPGGTFECWRLDVEIHVWEAERLRMWVSRDKGWLIKLQYRGSDFVRNQVLQSYEPAPEHARTPMTSGLRDR